MRLLNHIKKFGIDAPRVIILLCGLGLLALFGAALLATLLHPQAPLWRDLGVLYLLVTSCTLLIPSILMLYSSVIGKGRLAKELAAALHIPSHAHLLDVGCGSGLFLIELAKRFETAHLFGIDSWKRGDLSGNHAMRAMENAASAGVAAQIEVHTADMRSIPFPDQTFDLVLSCLAIHNVKGREERGQALLEMARVVKPGGKILLIDFRYGAEYRAFFTDLGWQEVVLSKPLPYLFPRVRALTGKKR